MHSRPGAIAVAMTLAAASSAATMEIRDDWPLELGGRLESVVEVDRESSPVPWDFSSRSPAARSRLMLDLRLGASRYGQLYLKGVGDWSLGDERGVEAPFSLDQGDYGWGTSQGGWSVAGRLHVNERRYFTGEMGGVLLDDDRVAAFRDQYGARIDGDASALRWTVLASGLDDGAGGARAIGYARAGWHATHVQAAVGYLTDAPNPDSLDNNTVIKAEVAAFFRGATLVVSHEQSGVDAFPSGSFRWGDWDGTNYSAIMPENGATFAELRVVGVPAPRGVRVDFVTRYRAVGKRYVNDLAGDEPDGVNASAGLYAGHRALAADGRLLYRRLRARSAGLDVERVEATARALFRSGGDVFARAAIGRRRDDTPRETDERFLHLGVRRNLKKHSGGLHAMVRDTDSGEVGYRWALDLRLVASASAAFYGRLVQDEEATGYNALYLRLELRPMRHVFATFAYGRSFVGDDPFVLEDTDISSAGPTDDVYTITVRGDF